MNAQRPTWVEISLPALVSNFAALQRRAACDGEFPAQLIAVVKCDAYGHGAAPCATALSEAGAQWFAVTSPEEGAALRVAAVRQRILLLSGFYRDQAELVVARRLTPSVWELEQLDHLSRAVTAAGFRGAFPVHVEVDTGMSRQGVPLHQLRSFIDALASKRNLQLEGIYHHYAESEVVDSVHGNAQASAFTKSLTHLLEAGMRPRYFHQMNSAGLVSLSSSYLAPLFRSADWRPQQLCRTGIALYGYCLRLEGSSHAFTPLAVAPILAWKSRIISLREVPAGTRVGYSGTFTTSRTTRIASIPVGYGDGLGRRLSNRARMLVRGGFAPTVGNISMDMTLLDVTDAPAASLGDEVVILGAQGALQIDAWDHADLSGTIPYEVLCNISKRVPREYIL